jgi:dTDP-4-dehydrorhamnose reductase
MSEQVLVTGVSGLLGQALARAAVARGLAVLGWWGRQPFEAAGVRSMAVDLTNAKQVCAALREARPTVVFHCAALTNVDECEREPERCRAVNVEAVRLIAQVCRQCECRLVLISTDAVFDGSRGGYAEDSPTDPVNAYGQAKLLGEREALRECPETLVIRTTMFGLKGNGQTLAEWILARLRRGEDVPGFVDVRFSPLFVADLSDLLLELVERRVPPGIYHVAAADGCTKFDFAVRLAEAYGCAPERIRPAWLSGAKLAAPRPHDTTLRIDKVVRALARPLPTIAAGISRFRQAYPELCCAYPPILNL